MEEAIFITGEESVKAVETLASLYLWRLNAQMCALGFRTRQGMTVKAFNAQYGQKARKWTDVAQAANDLLQAHRQNMGIAPKS